MSIKSAAAENALVQAEAGPAAVYAPGPAAGPPPFVAPPPVPALPQLSAPTRRPSRLPLMIAIALVLAASAVGAAWLVRERSRVPSTEDSTQSDAGANDQ
jgi:hypothetical protein